MPDLVHALVPRTTHLVTVCGLAITCTLANYLVDLTDREAMEPETRAADGGDELRTVLVASGMEWDLTMKGEPIPTDMAGLRTVPAAFLNDFWGELLGNSSRRATTSSEIVQEVCTANLN